MVTSKKQGAWRTVTVEELRQKPRKHVKPQKGDQTIITNRAIWVVCQRCDHGWFYKSDKRRAICKQCGTSVRTGLG